MAPPTGIPFARPARPDGFAEFSAVTLTRTFIHKRKTFTTGTRGIILRRHPGTTSYEVEFNDPIEVVLTLPAGDLR